MFIGIILLACVHFAAGQADGGADANSRVTVQTRLGSIVGERRVILGRNVDRFLGIPFAQPPVGDLRFKKPLPVERWDTVDARRLPNACAQLGEVFKHFKELEDTTEDEDCLYLNIWVPDGANNTAVMVWIHGGGFSNGYGAIPEQLPAQGDVILVSIQYRVGMLGYLYLGTEDAPGNVAFLDQHMALEWVHNHIRDFGGDPEQVTIFGESAGAVCVLLHTVSPLPRYFQNVIAQSPAGLQVYPASTAYGTAMAFAGKLGCIRATPSDIADCLRSLEWRSFVEDPSNAGFRNFSTVDGEFLTKIPDERDMEAATDLRVILGSTENEGVFFINNVFRDFFQGERPVISEDRFREILGRMTGILEEDVIEYLSGIYSYAGDNLDRLDEMIGDLIITCSTRKFALAFQDGGTNQVYLYRMDHSTSGRPDSEPAWTGARHALEVDHVFGAPIARDLYPYYTQEESDLSEQMVGYWTNLAKYRTPNDGNIELEWPEYMENEKKYLILNTRSNGGIRIDTALKEKQCKFWDNIYPGLMERKSLEDLLKAYGMDDDAVHDTAGRVLPVASHVVGILFLACWTLHAII